METDSFDIDRYLPFKSVQDVESFCDPDDGMLTKKKDALTKRIFAACDVSSSTNFVSSVATVLFDTEFIRTHKWPTKKLVKKKLSVPCYINLLFAKLCPVTNKKSVGLINISIFFSFSTVKATSLICLSNLSIF